MLLNLNVEAIRAEPFLLPVFLFSLHFFHYTVFFFFFLPPALRQKCFEGAVELETAAVNREKCAAHLFKGHGEKSGAGMAKQNACPLPRGRRVTSRNRFEKHLPEVSFLFLTPFFPSV